MMLWTDVLFQHLLTEVYNIVNYFRQGILYVLKLILNFYYALILYTLTYCEMKYTASYIAAETWIKSINSIVNYIIDIRLEGLETGRDHVIPEVTDPSFLGNRASYWFVLLLISTVCGTLLT